MPAAVSIHGYDVVKDYRQARMRLGVVPQELVFDPFFFGARNAAHAIRLFRHQKERRLDRRGDA